LRTSLVGGVLTERDGESENEAVDHMSVTGRSNEELHEQAVAEATQR
jgi:hypothetical protein